MSGQCTTLLTHCEIHTCLHTCTHTQQIISTELSNQNIRINSNKSPVQRWHVFVAFDNPLKARDSHAASLHSPQLHINLYFFYELGSERQCLFSSVTQKPSPSISHVPTTHKYRLKNRPCFGWHVRRKHCCVFTHISSILYEYWCRTVRFFSDVNKPIWVAPFRGHTQTWRRGHFINNWVKRGQKNTARSATDKPPRLPHLWKSNTLSICTREPINFIGKISKHITAKIRVVSYPRKAKLSTLRLGPRCFYYARLWPDISL